MFLTKFKTKITLETETTCWPLCPTEPLLDSWFIFLKVWNWRSNRNSTCNCDKVKWRQSSVGFKSSGWSTQLRSKCWVAIRNRCLSWCCSDTQGTLELTLDGNQCWESEPPCTFSAKYFCCY